MDYFNRTLSKDKLEDYKGAIDDYTKIIKLESNNKRSYHNRGISKAKLKDHRGAICDFTMAIELSPNLACKLPLKPDCFKLKPNQKVQTLNSLITSNLNLTYDLEVKTIKPF